MKVLIVGDVHYAQYSSIVRSRGKRYSKRLENLIESINWAEHKAAEVEAEEIIYLGDLFDRADLNAEEISAFREIEWTNNIFHVFLTGNHEIATRSLAYSSARLVEGLGEDFKVVDKPSIEEGLGYEFIYIPYVFEAERKPLEEYIKEARSYSPVHTDELRDLYIFSHNDIKGVQYGLFESTAGFEKEEIIKSGCKFFINGHIHNKGWIEGNKILNLGNLTGQNFNEDGVKYHHTVAVLDTDKKNLEFYENPYAYNFLKLEILEREDFKKIPDLHNLVLSIKCAEELVTELRGLLDNNPQVVEYRVITIAQDSEEEQVEETQSLTSVDHLQQFQAYIISQLGKSNVVLKELQEVIG